MSTEKPDSLTEEEIDALLGPARAPAVVDPVTDSQGPDGGLTDDDDELTQPPIGRAQP